MDKAIAAVEPQFGILYSQLDIKRSIIHEIPSRVLLTLLKLSQAAHARAAPSHLLMLAFGGIRPSMKSPNLVSFQPRDRIDMPLYTVRSPVELRESQCTREELDCTQDHSEPLLKLAVMLFL